jgi:hypothetical protein
MFVQYAPLGDQLYIFLPWGTKQRPFAHPRAAHQDNGGSHARFHCAFIQLSDPVTLTDRSEKKIRSGASSAVPR